MPYGLRYDTPRLAMFSSSRSLRTGNASRCAEYSDTQLAPRTDRAGESERKRCFCATEADLKCLIGVLGRKHVAG